MSLLADGNNPTVDTLWGKNLTKSTDDAVSTDLASEQLVLTATVATPA